MDYHLANLETQDYIELDKQAWLKILSAAYKGGWRPKGTVMQLGKQDIHVTHIGGETITIGSAINNTTHWSGNYMEMRRQIVTKRDSFAFADALKGSSIDPIVISFIAKGAFRIGKAANGLDLEVQEKAKPAAVRTLENKIEDFVEADSLQRRA